MWTCRLDDDAALDRGRAGGKAAGLATLRRAGLPVPDGFVILADALDPLAGDAALDVVWSDAAVRAESARRTERARTIPFPPGFEEELQTRLAALGGGAVAVRSSASDEDARERSAAGQYESVLAVTGAGAVLAAIRDAWASVHAFRPAMYRARAGRAPFAVRAAIVVQRMAEAEVSGVAFTRDPIRPRRERLVVEAAPGVGGVVSGGVVERWELPRDAAVPMAPPPAGSLLDAPALAELARLALAAESALGAPADVEWAWSRAAGFALVQLRPITAVRALRLPRRRIPHEIVWTQRFSGERWTEPATPLGWTLVEPSLSRYTHWTWASRRYLSGTRMSRLHAGIPYFNVTIFRHLLIKTPWTPTPEFVLELFPADTAASLRTRRWLLPTPGLVLLVLAEAVRHGRWRGHRFLWFTNPGDWERLAPRIEEAARRTNLDVRDAAAAIVELERLRGWIDRYVGVHLWSLLWANLFYQALGVALERFGGRAAHALRPALVVGGAEENVTVRTNLAVAELAVTASRDEHVRALLASAPSGDAALAALRADDSAAGRAFLRALDELLAEYGHRARSTWEAFSPRWRDDAGSVLDMVRSALASPLDARDREARAAAAREAAETALGGMLRGWRRGLVGWLLGRTRVFSHLRENQRFVFDRLMLALRDVALRAGALLEAGGRLPRATDVSMLELPELHALAAGSLSAHEAARRIAGRRREWEAAARTPAPTFLFGRGAAPEGRGAPASASSLLRGIGVSPGRARGIARVARTLEEASRLRAGEVLVAKATDPGWTPFFPAAAGLVTELGGLLSHAAVVAREYGLPAVANVNDVTALVRDGDELMLDGDEGVVYLRATKSRVP